MNSRLLIVAAATVSILAVFVLGGCGGSSSGTGRITVELVDAPLEADAINVEITSVEVHKAGEGWITLKEWDTPLACNLLEYSADGEKLMLADCPLASGEYTMIRLHLASAQIVKDGETFDVDLSNVEETGIKCNGPFTVEDGELMAVILDFNTERSFVMTGKAMFMLHPVMTMSPVNVASKVTGTVSFDDTSILTADAVVNLYRNGSAGVQEDFVASACLGEDGTFQMDVVPAGTYDLQVVYLKPQAGGDPISLTFTVEDVVVVPGATDLGTITVPAS